MNIIVPMAGLGKRMRPHTLTTPKPLINLAGKAIVYWLLQDIVKVCNEKVEEIAFIIGDFGNETENTLLKIANDLGSKGSIYYQQEALGTAHAILCAKPALKGKVTIAFADTLFKADFTMDTNQDGIIWVHKVKDPRQFGVVKINKDNYISEFVEKPQEFISDLAIIGIYYFKDGENLCKELQFLIDYNIKDKGEYQITNAMENMKNKGMKFFPGKVSEWLDCGNKNSTVSTHQRYLEFIKDEKLISSKIQSINSVIIPPCYIGDDVVIRNSVIGPYVSIGKYSQIENSIISDSILQNNCKIKDANLSNSMLGNFAEFYGVKSDVSLGDYCTIGD